MPTKRRILNIFRSATHPKTLAIQIESDEYLGQNRPIEATPFHHIPGITEVHIHKRAFFLRFDHPLDMPTWIDCVLATRDALREPTIKRLIVTTDLGHEHRTLMLQLALAEQYQKVAECRQAMTHQRFVLDLADDRFVKSSDKLKDVEISRYRRARRKMKRSIRVDQKRLNTLMHRQVATI